MSESRDLGSFLVMKVFLLEAPRGWNCLFNYVRMFMREAVIN